jgi:catechol 2,3-dioxygenase-like lactoylglutathione lyase family enzyme
MIRGMHHISLATTDMDRFVRFYRDLLGVTLDRISALPPDFEAFETVVGLRKVKGQVAQFNLGNMNMEVFCYSDPAPRPGERRPACDAGIRHIAFDVKDIFVEYERLRAQGVDFISPPQHIAPGKCTSCYFYDPDGNILELQEIHAGSPVRPAFGIAGDADSGRSA